MVPTPNRPKPIILFRFVAPVDPTGEPAGGPKPPKPTILFRFPIHVEATGQPTGRPNPTILLGFMPPAGRHRGGRGRPKTTENQPYC